MVIYIESEKQRDEPCSDANNPIVFPSMSDCTEGTKDTCQQGEKTLLRFRNLFPIIVHPSGYRIYEWGTCDVNSTKHSDFALLRSLLFDRANMQRLIAATAMRTARYAKQKDKEDEAQVVYDKLTLYALVMWYRPLSCTQQRCKIKEWLYLSQLSLL